MYCILINKKLNCMKGNENNNELQRNTQMIIKKFVDIVGLCDHTTYSKTTIYKLMRDEDAKFPTPYNCKYVEKRVVWIVEEVDQWLANNLVKQVNVA